MVIYDRLVFWFVQQTKSKDSALVIKKICCALVAYYLRPPVTWNQIILRLNKGLLGVAIDTEEPIKDDFTACVRLLDEHELHSMLWFVETLVHELSKTNTSTLQGCVCFLIDFWNNN